MTAQYSIKDLERLSGIKAHTIRIWEKRYGLLSPSRTNTNIRFYDDEHLKRLLDVSLLQRDGYKISKISQLSEPEIKSEIERIHEQSLKIDNQFEPLIHGMVKAMIDLNEKRFEHFFANSVLRHGLEDTIRLTIFPFLNRVGMLWNLGEINPGQEHFVSNLVKQKLFSAIDALPHDTSGNQLYVLYLIESELHELSLLFAAYLLRKRGKEVLYLGQSVPFESLNSILHNRNISGLISIVTTRRPASDIQKHINQISPILRGRTLHLYVEPETRKQLQAADNVELITSLDNFFGKL